MPYRRYRFLSFAFLICLTCLLSACGYRYLTAKDRPSSLESLHIDSPNNDSYFSVLLERRLTALGINTHSEHGPQLHIKKLTFTHPQPNLFNSGTSYTVLHTITARWQLMDSTGKPLTKIITTTQSIPIIHNANQFDTPSMQTLTYHNLSQRLVQLMVYRIFSDFSSTAHQKQEANHAIKK